MLQKQKIIIIKKQKTNKKIDSVVEANYLSRRRYHIYHKLHLHR